MSITNRNIYKPEITINFEAQAPVSSPRRLIEVRENLYKDRMTTWYEFIPSGYQPGTPVPLVLQMHGGSGDGLRDALETDWHRVAEENDFIVAYPNSHLYGRWECDDADIETIRRLILRICDRYTIDRTRIYMQGMSNGDMITTAFVLEHPELLAAAGFIAGPLPKEMLPHLPQGPLPCIQIRGEKDVHFGQRMDFERDDVYQPKSAMNDYNRRMWMEANHTVESPEMYLRGKDNFFIYRGECDLIYWEVHDMGHRYPPCVASVFWDYCYSGWAREDGKSIRLTPRRQFKKAGLQFAVAVGGKGVYQDGTVIPFTLGSSPDCLLVHPARQEEDSFYDVGEMLLTPAIYTPVEALAIGFHCQYEVGENVSTALLRTPNGREYRFFRDSSAVLADGETLSLKKPCFHRFGLFFVPIVDVAAELFGCFTAVNDGVVAVSDHPVELSKGAARIIAHQLNAPARYPEPTLSQEPDQEAINEE